jgi:hypothetical protein
MTSGIRLFILGVFLLFFFTLPARAGSYRLYFAAQYDWERKTGFSLDLESEAPDGTPCRLSGAKIAMGVGSGQEWRFLSHSRNWQLNHDYTITAVIRPGAFELNLDGEQVGQSSGILLPKNDVDLNANLVPSWANSPAEYLAIQKSFLISSADGKNLSLNLDRSLGLVLLTSQSPSSLAWKTDPSQTITITAVFRLIPTPDPRSLAPFVDRYGQSKHGDWPGKIKSDSDLTAAAIIEQAWLAEWGLPQGFDSYGGILNAGWQEQSTGFYRLARHDGMWWLITPLGNPCFYISLGDAPALNWDRTPVTGRPWMFEELPPKTPPWDFAWGLNSWGQNDGTEDVAFHTVNMIRKYGDGWKDKATALTIARMKAWGFSGLGKWCADAGNLPITPVLHTWGVPILDRHPDIFDPAVQAQLRSVLAAQISPRVQDPLIVGWSLHNEYDDIITTGEIRNMLALPASVMAKKTLVDEALAKLYQSDITRLAAAWNIRASTVQEIYSSAPTLPAEDLEALRRFFARRYYDFLYRTFKELDPNHLYFGFWIVPGWWENESDWELIADYCDVIGYDRYSPFYADSWMQGLIRKTNKPILLGEFSFPPTYNLERGFRSYPLARAIDDEEAGRLYFQWLSHARQDPYCVGVSWFQYRDEPVSGRGPGQGSDLVYGESFAFGLVDVGDRPKYDLVEWIRLANLQAARLRLSLDRESFQLPRGFPLRKRNWLGYLPVAQTRFLSLRLFLRFQAAESKNDTALQP